MNNATLADIPNGEHHLWVPAHLSGKLTMAKILKTIAVFHKSAKMRTAEFCSIRGLNIVFEPPAQLSVVHAEMERLGIKITK